MIRIEPYNRERAVEYARKWAFSRNPLFYDFTGQGGNCTSFISQCLFAGTCQMNYKPTFGWYYITVSRRSPAWTGVDYLYNFLIENAGPDKFIGDGLGPFGHRVEANELELGDVIQLGKENDDFYHTLIISGFSRHGLLVSAQSDDSFNRPLRNYVYDTARYIHIDGFRTNNINTDACYEKLINGHSL